MRRIFGRERFVEVDAEAGRIVRIQIAALRARHAGEDFVDVVREAAPLVDAEVGCGKLEVKKGGQLVGDLTIFNSDIRGFTAMSEGTTAEVIVEMLNEYFELMVETLFKYEGTLDKFMGDGIMAFWGAPLAHRDDPIRCVQCAIDQMHVLGRFNRQRIAGDVRMQTFLQTWRAMFPGALEIDVFQEV